MKSIVCTTNLCLQIAQQHQSTKMLIEKLDREALLIDFLTTMVKERLKFQKCSGSNLQEDLKEEINQKNAVKEANLLSSRKNPLQRMINLLIPVTIEKKEKRISKSPIPKGLAMFDFILL